MSAAKKGAPDKKAPKTKIVFIKKKGKGHAHHGGAWKVAYADFVTAMMALFMVLWLVSQTDESTRSQLSHYFRTGVFTGSGHVIGDSVPSARAPLSPGAGAGLAVHGEQESLEQHATAIERALDEAIAEDPALADLRELVDVEVTLEGLLIRISDGGDDLFFDLSSSSLRPPLAEFLARIAPVLSRLPNRVQVHGHTDSRPFPRGSARSNWSLSFERADAARELLERSGLREGQVAGIVAHGDTALARPDDPLAAANRRLSILAVRRGGEDRASRGEEGAPFVHHDAPPAPEEPATGGAAHEDGAHAAAPGTDEHGVALAHLTGGVR